MTNALQITFDVRSFNSKMGLYKDASNTYIINTEYDYVNDVFPTDSITITTADILNIDTSQIMSVGSYSTVYSDFINYVKEYFGYVGGFTTLFSNAETFSYNDGIFDASAFMQIIQTTSDSSGGYTDLSGNITISNITKLLRTAVDSNAFGNRNVTTGTTSSDPSNNSNYGVADGFIEGDLIFVPTGISITLNLDIDTESFLSPLNNIGPDNVGQSSNYVNGNFSQVSSATTSSIKQTITAPLLIKLMNLSTDTLSDISAVTDLSVNFYDSSAIQFTFSVPNNNYAKYYTYNIVVTDTCNNTIDKTITGSPALIQNLSGNMFYTAYVKDTYYTLTGTSTSITHKTAVSPAYDLSIDYVDISSVI
jgi:hypothetical protein